MKKTLRMMTVAFTASILLTSCYSYTSVVGKGALGTQKVKKWNHYFIEGLAPGNISNSRAMAGTTENYTVETKQTFVNGLIAAVTFGIYTPTVTTVTK
ncbi:Bor family protein [Chryseobacterium polytrichastri]|uniref:Bor protein n=1 Tax=Chryseobacterium polytrichastri TaxID=1302687 RepID=A0A1M7L837_9FLAO|nr:Bor family protein [Chryseobacterium polytrichastri]SHM73685.1 Bor protein [Chryseobacterium polytrichastri]